MSLLFFVLFDQLLVDDDINNHDDFQLESIFFNLVHSNNMYFNSFNNRQLIDRLSDVCDLSMFDLYNDDNSFNYLILFKSLALLYNIIQHSFEIKNIEVIEMIFFVIVISNAFFIDAIINLNSNHKIDDLFLQCKLLHIKHRYNLVVLLNLKLYNVTTTSLKLVIFRNLCFSFNLFFSLLSMSSCNDFNFQCLSLIMFFFDLFDARIVNFDSREINIRDDVKNIEYTIVRRYVFLRKYKVYNKSFDKLIDVFLSDFFTF